MESQNDAQVASAQLASQYPQCNDYGSGSIGRFLGTDQDAAGSGNTVSQDYNNGTGDFTKLGSYYYEFYHDQGACMDNTSAAAVQAQNTANDLLKDSLPNIKSIN